MKHEFSAGGVVFKKEKGSILVLLGKHSQNKSWAFPKGLIGDTYQNESKEATAVREVLEETGVEAVILKPLASSTYWYQWEDEQIKKTVYYFLMEAIKEDFTKRDGEMEEVLWLPQKEVKGKLTYPGDKKIWEEAQKEIQTWAGIGSA